MLKPYILLENILFDIESGVKENINVQILSQKYDYSEGHLCRLFRFAFKQTIAAYIRSRTLTASLNDILETDINILDIALEYGFDYEQSYIRAFKREFGITPGDLRKTRQIVKITPPLNLFNSKKYSNGIMFGPEIVIVPQFHAIGKNNKQPFRDVLFSSRDPFEQLIDFDLMKKKIKNTVNPHVMINISRTAGGDADYCFTMPAVQVKNLDYIPEGFDHYTFETSTCAKFRFIVRNLNELNMHGGDEMYNAIDDFMDDENQKYFLERKKFNIDRFDKSYFIEGYILWEWFAPVTVKKSLTFSPSNPSGIKKVYKQELPALRFIGKKCIEEAKPQNILCQLDNCQINKTFNEIEKQSDIDYKAFFKGGDAYISLVRKNKNGSVDHWIGMFLPEGTEGLQDYETIDFPKMTIGVFSVYGKRSEIVNYENECRKKLNTEGFVLKNKDPENQYYFRRFNWHRFFEEDVYGKRFLDYCYQIK